METTNNYTPTSQSGRTNRKNIFANLWNALQYQIMTSILPFQMKKKFRQLNDSVYSSHGYHCDDNDDDSLLQGVNFLSDDQDVVHQEGNDAFDFVTYIGYWEDDCDDHDSSTSTVDVLPMIKDEVEKLSINDDPVDLLQNKPKRRTLNTRALSRIKRLLLRSPSTKTTTDSDTEPMSPSSSEEDDSSTNSFFSKDPFSDNKVQKKLATAYSERSIIGDGSENVLELLTVTSPVDVIHRDLQPNDCHASVSYWTEQNMRPYMEDRVVIDGLGHYTVFTSSSDSKRTEDTHPEVKEESTLMCSSPFKVEVSKVYEEELPISLVGLFDGHCGSNASQFCCDWISSYVQREHSFLYDMGSALQAAFFHLDQDFISQHVDGGTTACVCAMIGGSRIVCANAGDSRAIIVRRDGTAIALSEDHKPSLPRETKRITSLGGHIIYSSGRWRVQGKLAVSRGIGDIALKDYICSEPDIYDYTIDTENDIFLVVASDGIFDVLENDQIAELVRSYELQFTEDDNLKGLARKLCGIARSKGSRDNLSAVVIELNNNEGTKRFEI